MPRDPKPLLPAAGTLTLTPSDHVFLDEVDRMLHLALDRLGSVLESINPPSKYDFPAPHLRDLDDPPPAPAPVSFVPYGREFLRSVKGLQTLCNLWVMLKTTRAQAVDAPRPAADSAADEAPAAQTPANPALLAMVENLYKTAIPLDAAPRP